MNKKIIIITPYFPPSNAADMQRTRMSLPYFAALGWDVTIVTVDEKYSDLPKDDLLLESIPNDIKVYKVKALNKKWTSKLGMGSLAFRSLWFYRQKVNALLKNEKFDLVYFSTTQFPVCILGAYWKNRFGIPYIIDMQDPWYSEYYKDKPKDQQPAKYKLAYAVHRYLEPIAIKNVDGLIAVSENYITDLKIRYPEISEVPSAIITFGAFDTDFKIAADNKQRFKQLLSSGTKNVVYIGRGGVDLHNAIHPVLKVLAQGLTDVPHLFKQLKFYFIGTSYAPTGEGQSTITPLAKQLGVENNVIEITDRISYYHSLLTLQQADALFIPGSNSPGYTASKIYPSILANKPLLAIFNSESSAINVLAEYESPYTYSYDKTPDLDLKVYSFLMQIANGDAHVPAYNALALRKYSAQNIALQQSTFFNRIINE